MQTYKQLSNYHELVDRVETLRSQRRTLSDIAATLNAEGYHPPKRTAQFTKGMLSSLLRERRASTGSLTSGRQQHHLKTNEWWLADLASELSMPIATLHRWRKVGWVHARKVTEAHGRWAIYADAEELQRLRQLRDTPRGWPQPYPQELITSKQKNEGTKTTE